jgi:hypothetical protein
LQELSALHNVENLCQGFRAGQFDLEAYGKTKMMAICRCCMARCRDTPEACPYLALIQRPQNHSGHQFRIEIR